MVTVQQMIVSFRCPLRQVVSWLAFNGYAQEEVVVKKVNDNGSEATMEIAGSPEVVVQVANAAGQFDIVMHDLKAKFR